MSPWRSKSAWLFLDLGNVVLDVDKGRASALFTSYTGLAHEEFDWIFFGSGLLDDFNVGRMSEAAFVLRVQGDVRYRGASLSDDEVHKVWTSMLVPVEGTDDWLRELEPQLAGIWVVSDINPIHWRAAREWLDTIGLKGIKGATLSCEVGVTKPDERVFADALSRSGAPAAKALFVDDRSINIEGAERLGIQGVHFVGPDQARKASAAWLKGLR